MRRRLLLALLTAIVVAATASAAPAATPALVQIGTFAAPTGVSAPLGDTSRVFVVEQAGTVRVVKDGVTLPRPFLDIRGDVESGGERGLLSIAFDRDYVANGRFWIYYTRAGSGAITVEEGGRSAADPEVADPGARRVVLSVPHGRQGNHNGGQLQVAPDGMLDIGTGDGGSGGDPAGNGQNLSSSTPAVVGGVDHHPLLGKILRVDARSGVPYAIPSGQPIAPGAAPEIFLYGVRNPWRFSFDRDTGDLIVGDVGERAFEEVDLLPAGSGGGLGANLGWNRFEGLHTYPGGAVVSSPPAGFTFPVLERAHSPEWCSLTGGYVVRDRALPELAGQYVFGDYCGAQVWAARLAPGGATDVRALDLGQSVSSISSFGEDGCGRVYVASLSGPVFRLATSGACSGPAPLVGYLPAGAGPPVTPGTQADDRPPRLTIRRAARQRALRARRLRLVVSCDEQCDVVVRATIRVRRPGARRARAFPALTVRRTLAAGARVRLAVRIPRRTRVALTRALRRRAHRRAEAVVVVVARDAAGNAARRRARIAIVRS